MSKPRNVPTGTPATEDCPLCCRPARYTGQSKRLPSYECPECNTRFTVRQVQAQERPAVAA
jgi:transposase-like protein